VGELHPLLLTFFCNVLFLVYFPLSAIVGRHRCVGILSKMHIHLFLCSFGLEVSPSCEA
jgi:hypothetical protein